MPKLFGVGRVMWNLNMKTAKMEFMVHISREQLQGEIKTLERALYEKRSALKSLDLVGEAPERTSAEWQARLDQLTAEIGKHSKGGNAVNDVRAMRDAD